MAGSALPHPGPLPLGEGESLALSTDDQTGARGAISQQPVTVRSLFPLPTGEGKGEGESSDRMQSHIS